MIPRYSQYRNRTIQYILIIIFVLLRPTKCNTKLIFIIPVYIVQGNGLNIGCL